MDDRRVLVINPKSEMEEVLKAVLEPRGLQVELARHLDSPAAASEQILLIIDDDSHSSDSSGAKQWGSVPRVIIGSARVPENAAAQHRRYLTKPFQYTDLIRAIDQLLTERAA